MADKKPAKDAPEVGHDELPARYARAKRDEVPERWQPAWDAQAKAPKPRAKEPEEDL